MALTEDDRIKMLEAIASDDDVKPTTRLRALEELGRIESRKIGGSQADLPDDGELPPDPMADLDEMERKRRERSRRKAS